MSVRRIILWENFISAWRQLAVHPLRSFLTILGITIGMAALISMMGIGEGTRQRVIAEMERLGGTGIIDVSHKRPAFHPEAQEWLTEDHLTQKDLSSFTRASRYIDKMAPVVMVNGWLSSSKGEKLNGKYFGTTKEYADIRDWQVANGRFLKEMDIEKVKYVCVIGAKIQEELFGAEDSIDQMIFLNGTEFRVVGVMAKMEMEAGRWLNELVVVPLTTSVRTLPVQDKISQVLIRVTGQEYVSVVKDQLRRALERRHDETDQFMINSQADVIQSVNESSMLMKLSFGSIAVIVLLVGGIGIMNLMLISVTERTREIGIHLAVGAGKRDILCWFLIEAVVLSFLGGLLGVFIGVQGGNYLALFISNYLDTTIVCTTSLKVILLAVISSVGIGLVFGFYPAMNASRVDPAEALSYE